MLAVLMILPCAFAPQVVTSTGLACPQCGPRLSRLRGGVRLDLENASAGAPARPPAPAQVIRGYGWSLLTLPITFLGYLYSSRALDALLVNVLSFNRASGDAFGPFVTLLGLVYSILLAQIYSYYFARQGVIQDCLYQELAALKTLSEAIELLAERYVPIAQRRTELLEILLTQARALLACGFTPEVRLLSRSSAELLTLLDVLEEGCSGASGSRARSGARSGSHDVRRLCTNAVESIWSARSTRVSAIAAELPRIQTFAQRVVSVAVLLGFVLVDLGAPRLEALLFACLTAIFVLINIFISDLSDPFGGSWSVEPARDELKELVATLSQM